jgi:imidazolonepropionase-like amidohydrolase
LPVCTTLAVGDIIVQKLFRPAAFLARPETRYLPAQYLDVFRAGREKHQGQFRGNEDVAAMKYEIERLLLAELNRAGVRLLLGTDSGSGAMGIVPGFSVHDELRILTKSGFTPYEAIAAGSSQASKVVAAMTGKNAFGTVEVGKRADLLLVSANPLDDVSTLKDLRGVMAAGRWYPRAVLDRLIAVRG